MAVIKKVSRAEIVVSKDGYDEAEVRDIWNEVCGDHLAMMRPKEMDDGIHLLIYPFRHFEVTNEGVQMPKSLKTEVSWSRKLIMEGSFVPGKDNFMSANYVIDRYWMPIRRCGIESSSHYGKRVFSELTAQERKDLNSVALLVVTNRNTEWNGTRSTDMTFCVSGDLHRPLKGVTANERVVRTLDHAVWLFAEPMRLIIGDINPQLMRCARLLDELSMNFAEKLDKYAVDKIQESYEAKGLRYFDNDAIADAISDTE